MVAYTNLQYQLRGKPGMMKVQKIDRGIVGSAAVEGHVIHSVYMAPSDLAIVVSVHPATLHCYKCSLLSSGVSTEACEHIKIVRKAQNTMANAIPEQPVDKFVFILSELVEIIENCVILSPYNQSKLVAANRVLHELRDAYEAKAYKPPVNGA